MTQWDNIDTTDASTPNTNDGGGLRQFAEKVQEDNKALQAQLAAIQKELTSQKLQSVFDSAGVPGALAHYTGDADPEKAKAWITTMQGAFNASGTHVPSSNAPAPVDISPEQQAQFQNLNNAGAQGTPLGTIETALAGVSDASDLQGLISNFQNAARSQ